MSQRACPSELELDRAFSVGADPELARHVDGCATCRSWWDDTATALKLARELPVQAPAAHNHEERRTAMLAAWDLAAVIDDRQDPVRSGRRRPSCADVRRRPHRPRRGNWRRRWGVVAIAFGLAASLVVVVAAVRSGPEDAATVQRRSRIYPHVGAQFTLAAERPDEIVRLRDGKIDVDVDPLWLGERFRVVVGTDEVEVRGTSFEVVAASDHLVAVHVVHGRVEVKRSGTAPIVLTAGEAWNTTTKTAAAASPKPIAVVPHSSPAIAHGVNRVAPPAKPVANPPEPQATATETPQESAFVRGWEAMRQGELGEAAAAFHRAIALAPDGALSEDATFWHAVAVARLHRTSEAIAAFRGFLDGYPTSSRAGEASAMLGWLLVDIHEFDEARRRFRAAENDSNAAARASAARGLRDCETTRTSPQRR